MRISDWSSDVCSSDLIHSSLKAMVDAPAWRLVKALDTLVSDDSNTVTIDGYPEVPPLSEQDKAMIAAAVARTSEATARKQLGVQPWIDDLSWQQANERLGSQQTVNRSEERTSAL